MHCTASGKLFLAQLSPAQRKRLLGQAELEQCTPRTLTQLDALEAELARVKRDGFAMDNEEFLPGLLCVAVLVPPAAGRGASGKSNLAVAVQAPVMRLTPDKALQMLPALQRAAAGLSEIDASMLESA